MPTRTIQTKPEPSCPKCGARMVLKRPRPDQNWDAFWGCNRFPDCHGTRNIDPYTGKPESDEDMIDDQFRRTVGHYANDLRRDIDGD